MRIAFVGVIVENRLKFDPLSWKEEKGGKEKRGEEKRGEEKRGEERRK